VYFELLQGQKFGILTLLSALPGPGSSSANGESTTPGTISNLYSTSDVNAYIGNFQEWQVGI